MRTGLPPVFPAIFQNLQLTRRDTSAGPCDLPIRYHDASLLVVGYRVGLDRVRSQLAGIPLEPMAFWGKALVILGLFEYRDTSIGPYNEVGLSVYAKRLGTSPSPLRVLQETMSVEDVGMHVFNLPVNTENACAAGVDLWGFPKYVSEIQTSFQPGRVEGRLGQEFSIVHQRRPFAFETCGMPFVTYSIHHNRFLRTITEVENRIRVDRGSKVRLKLLGDGPTTRTIQALGLDRMRPLLAFRTDGLRCLLPAGIDKGAAR
jgi:hypothetical protein